MTTPLALLVLLAPASLLAVAVASRRGTVPDHHGTARRGAVATWAGVLVASVAAAAVAFRGTIESPPATVSGLGVSVRLDGLSVTMLAMVALLSVVVFRYSATYLDGDPRRGTFLARLAVTITAVEVLLVAGNLALVLAAWVATSLALHELLVFYPQRRRAVVAARKKFVTARLGDVLLAAAIVLLWHHAGTGDLAAVFASASADPGALAIQAAAVCLVLAAALKSAQFPTHSWLIEVMETPTPVSALLHAGILNAGVFLVIRMSYVIESSGAATLLLIAIGATTAAFASVALLTQPSVKVALGYSSAAHMGFMLMICGSGVYAAALLHLVAHSFYKAHAFLSSASAIDEARAADVALPRRLGSPARIAVSSALAFATYLALAAAFQVDLRGEPVLLAVGAILVLGTTQIIAPALDSEASWSATTARAVGLAAAVTVSFFALEAGAHHVLQDSAALDGPRGPLHLVALAAVVAGFATIVTIQIVDPTWRSTPRRRAWAVHLRNGLYAPAAMDRLVGALHRPRPARSPGRLASPAPLVAFPSQTQELNS